MNYGNTMRSMRREHAFRQDYGYLSATAALDVVANYDVSQVENIVDVGGTMGCS